MAVRQERLSDILKAAGGVPLFPQDMCAQYAARYGYPLQFQSDLGHVIPLRKVLTGLPSVRKAWDPATQQAHYFWQPR